MVVLTSYPPKYQVEHACKVVCAKPAETPEQAIESWNTRAEKTCHDTWDIELTGRLRFKCSECGAVSLDITPRYCPACGARVVEEVDADGQG